MRRIWAARMLACFAIGACQIDPRDFDALDPSAVDGSGGALVVLPSNVAYGPITLEFVASARFLVENAGMTTLAAPAVSLQDNGAGTFTLTRNDCTGALQRGTYCEVAVAFRPNDLSARAGTLSISGSGRRFDIPLSGSGLEAGGLLLQAAPGSEVPFGEVPLQGEQEATLQLSNPTRTDSAAVELISNNTAFRLLPAQAGECVSSGTRLASGRSCNFRVRFAPSQRGVTDATITARSPESGSVSLGVSGRALAPARVLVDQTRLDFGDVVTAAAAVLDLSISNGGDEPLPALSSTIRGEAASDFQVRENDCSAPLPPGDTCSMRVAFSPRATGPHAAVLGLDAGSAGALSVELSGAGLPAGNLLVVAADGGDGDFRSVSIGSESEREFTIGNTSSEASGPLTIAVNSEDFSIEPPAGTECVSGVTNLAGGARCEVRVRFAPTQRRQRNATLTVSSGVGGAALNLSGVGIAAAEFRADGAVDFGAVSQGSTTMRGVVVTNTGDERMAPFSTRVSGVDGSSFQVQMNGCMAGLDAQGTCQILTLFAPTRAGSHSATLTIESQSGGSRDVALSGTATAPALLGVQPSEVTFPVPVDAGQSASAGLTVINRGDTLAGRVSASIAAATPGFSVSPGTCTAALASGESCELEVGFAPTAAGRYNNSIRITSTPGGTLEIPVSGTGYAPATLELFAVEGTDFGPVAITTSATRSFRLSNTGNFGIGTLLEIALGGSFSLAPRIGAECQPNVTQLDFGASCDFRVLFQPSAAGNFAITMAASTSLGGAAQLSLTGTGVVGAATLVGSASTLEFITPVRVNQGGAGELLTWTVRNTGSLPTETLVFTNSNTEEFPATTNTCFGSIAAGGECSSLFIFSPNELGQRTGLMTLTAGTLSATVTLIGTGI